MSLLQDIINQKVKISVIGLGYVGMPIAVAFAQKVKVIGFDINENKIKLYRSGMDPTNEVGEEKIKNTTVEFTVDDSKLKEAKFHIIAVPTPINLDKTPDLSPVEEASCLLGKNLTPGSIVVYESTVYPGVTEGQCAQILERESGLKCGKDFKIGYSPERINPGDTVHRLNNIKKIVSGMDDETLDIIARVYELIIDAGVHRVSCIKVAEAAKVVENSQRDINIAFMNELAMAFNRMGIDTMEVIEAMKTKWNAINFHPGLVGGHCIGVDPYYFIYQAERLGYHSQIILAGRKINDNMGIYIADNIIKQLILANKSVKLSKVVIFGITFKENCPDIRNSKVVDIITRLKEYELCPMVVDPLANAEEVREWYGIELTSMEEVKKADCLVFAVAHQQFKDLPLKQIEQCFITDSNDKKIIIDIKSILDKKKLLEKGYRIWRL